ncbi:MAG: transaldolase family protein [bacterium]|nr:transaldolase family protein [bacterium]
MRPSNLKTKIFLDSGDPAETKQALALLGFLDGQTTNPSLFAKNPEVQERLKEGKKFSREEVLNSYRTVVQEISALIPDGSVSVEVYADTNTSVSEMEKQAREMFTWIRNSHVKIPIMAEGIRAAEHLVRDGIRVNMTLCFIQEQAAAVYVATQGAVKGQVFLSPFVGRLDDRGENGMDFIANCMRMYGESDHHVEVLSASVRTLDHFLYALQLGSDIITAPLKILQEWSAMDRVIPGDAYVYDAKILESIPYVACDLAKPWQEFNISHELTDKGIAKFASDWNALIV